jgi:hypothetical protein
VSQEAPITGDAIDSSEWSNQDGKRIQAKRRKEMPSQKCGKGAGGSAARALKMKYLMERALRIEPVLRWWKEQQNANNERNGRRGSSRAHHPLNSLAAISHRG